MSACVQAIPVTNLIAIIAVCVSMGWGGYWAGRGLIESERSSRERFAALLVHLRQPSNDDAEGAQHG